MPDHLKKNDIWDIMLHRSFSSANRLKRAKVVNKVHLIVIVIMTSCFSKWNVSNYSWYATKSYEKVFCMIQYRLCNRWTLLTRHLGRWKLFLVEWVSSLKSVFFYIFYFTFGVNRSALRGFLVGKTVKNR